MEGGEVLMGKGNSADGCKELTGGFTASANIEKKHSNEEIALISYQKEIINTG